MRRPAHSIVNALTLVLCLSGSLALATEPTPDEANTPLKAVMKRESDVFASTPDGLFRAPLDTKRWERLKTPPEMPPGGNFAKLPGRSPLVIYVAMRSQVDPRSRPGSRYGLYLSRDDGATWGLVSERDDFGATLLLPSGALFAVTGADGINSGYRLLRSPDLGKTWRDITGDARGQFAALIPDPDHPGLVRIQPYGMSNTYMWVADDEDYRWRVLHERKCGPGRRPSDEFFSRRSFSTTTYYQYPATLANYFRYDFGNLTDVQALEVVPLKERFEFARGARIVVTVRVVFHYDPDADLMSWRQSVAAGHIHPRPKPPTIKLADRPGGDDFWGLRVESPDDQIEKYPPGRRYVTTSVTMTSDGKAVSSTDQPPAVKHQVVDLSPTSPYEREVDLGHFFDFSRPGVYRVQIIYDSGGHPNGEKGVWDGGFTSPVFTVVIRE